VTLKLVKMKSGDKTPPVERILAKVKLHWFLTGGTIAILFFILWVIYLSRDLPSFDQLENYTPELATQVFSADGVLIKEFYTKKRSFIPLSEIPSRLVQAVLATEDHRFYSHWGVAPLRIFRVIFTDLATMSTQQGASTLTQQLARQLYLTPQKTITRKIREIITAIQIERTYTKDEILEMYMNHMQFGYGTYGIESAARQFFDKRLDELTISETAMLAGMLQGSGMLNPYRYFDRTMKRRDLVLGRMLEEGVINLEEFKEAFASEIVLVPEKKGGESEIAPYFTEYIRQELQKTYGWDLYQGGLKIFTTLDTRVQACAERALKAQLPRLQASVNVFMHKKKNFAYLVPPSFLKKRSVEQLLADQSFADSLVQAKCPVQAAVMALDPRDGHILAMIGGRDFYESQYNRAIQAVRQPGSAFKPFVFTAAVDNGYMPFYEKDNQPIVLQMLDGTRWTPHNYDESIGGPTTLREALRRSLNLVTARLVHEDVPPEQVVKYAHNLGITTQIDAVDAVALGSSGVIPIEITSAFGVFANRGVLVKPVAILRVEDKYGNILEKATTQSKGVLREETAYIMANLLQTAAQSGTGATSVSVYDFTRPAGGKTGTTNDCTDAWYITFTPQMVASTWVGLDDPGISLGEKQSGAVAALPITVPFIKCAMDSLALPVEDFIRPSGVVDVNICRETKLLASEFCPEVLKEICDVRYLPKETCQIHTGLRSKNGSGTEQRNPAKRKIHY
jgi:penicillin-binding protein 1A